MKMQKRFTTAAILGTGLAVATLTGCWNTSSSADTPVIPPPPVTTSPPAPLPGTSSPPAPPPVTTSAAIVPGQEASCYYTLSTGEVLSMSLYGQTFQCADAAAAFESVTNDHFAVTPAADGSAEGSAICGGMVNDGAVQYTVKVYANFNTPINNVPGAGQDPVCTNLGWTNLRLRGRSASRVTPQPRGPLIRAEIRSPFTRRGCQLRRVNALTCRDPRFRLSQISWRTSVAHHPTEDTDGADGRITHRRR